MDWSSLDGPATYASHGELDSLRDAMAEGRATPVTLEFVLTGGGASTPRAINCGYGERLAVTDVTVFVEAGTLAADIPCILYESDNPEIAGSKIGRRSAGEEPTVLRLTLGSGAGTGAFVAHHWENGRLLKQDRHLGIDVTTPGAGPNLRIEVEAWRIAPRMRA